MNQTADAETPAVREPRWLRFSVRSVMAMVVVLSCVLAGAVWRRHHIRRQRAVVSRLQPFGGDAPNGDGNVTQITFTGPDFEAEALDLLSDLPHLRRLKFIGASIQDKDVVRLKGLSLAKLTFVDTPLSDDCLDSVARLDLRELWLDHTQITDEGLKQLAPLKNLEVLNLIGTAVSDDGLESLKQLPSLKHVMLQDTRVTQAAVAQLELDLPDARIDYSK